MILGMTTFKEEGVKLRFLFWNIKSKPEVILAYVVIEKYVLSFRMNKECIVLIVFGIPFSY